MEAAIRTVARKGESWRRSPPSAHLLREITAAVCCRKLSFSAGKAATSEDLDEIKYIIEHSGATASAVAPAVSAVAPLLWSPDAGTVIAALDCVDGLSSAPASSFAPHVGALVEPVVACSGHSRAAVRERAVDVLLALMDVAGPTEVFDRVRKLGIFRSRNGRLREQYSVIYVRSVSDFGSGALPEQDVLSDVSTGNDVSPCYPTRAGAILRRQAKARLLSTANAHLPSICWDAERRQTRCEGCSNVARVPTIHRHRAGSPLGRGGQAARLPHDALCHMNHA